MNPLLLQVFNRPWYIDRNSAVDLGWAVSSLLDGKLVFEADRKDFEPRAASGSSSVQSDKKVTGNVSIIPIQGALMQKDQFCGPVGMETIGEYIRNADKNTDVDAIILDINSPGGTVSGTANLGKIIASTKKPIIAFVNELAASAAYWLASQTDLIVASDSSAEVGSIGVMLSFTDVQPFYELQGVKFHELYSNLSTDKNKDIRDVRRGNYEDYKEMILDPLAEQFIATVKNGRMDKIKDESVFSGKMLFADKAIDAGLVDSIHSLDETIDIALGMASDAQTMKPQLATENNQTKTSSHMKKFPQLSAILGAEPEMNDGGSFLNEAQLDKLEGSLANHQAAIDKVAAERDKATSDLDAFKQQSAQDIESKNKDVSTLTAKVKEQETQIANLTKNGAEAGASVNLKKDPERSGESVPVLAELNACKDIASRMAVLEKYGIS